MKKKILALSVCVVMLAVAIVGGTLAYFTDTEAAENTFTVGNVDIDLKEETGNNYKMIPGTTLKKDPKVTVKAGSEDCYVFVKVEETDLTDYITYEIAEGWTKLDGTDNVYYREAKNNAEDITWSVLAGDEVAVKNTVANIAEGDAPALSFTAYAIQMASFNGDPVAAWEAGAWN